MGLNLNWELRLPSVTTPDEVRRKLTNLHQRASGLGFDEVTPVVDYAESEPCGDLESYFRDWAHVIARPDEESDPTLIGDVNSAMGFGISPGKGCEAAVFGALRRSTPDGDRAEWFWHQVCKTQYASVVNDDHLIFCHTALVALLDYAIDSGWDVIVRDEGHYWETRDPGRLVQEVHYMNRLVARIAGALSDKLESVGQPCAPIFDHPEFERLEMERP